MEILADAKTPAPAWSPSAPAWRVFWVPALFLSFALLFSGRPLFFDDPSFVAAARGAWHHPLRPYDYTLDLQRPDTPNWPRGGRPAATNPPLSSWLLGAIVALAGERVPFLHFGVFTVAIAALAFSRRIASRLAPASNAAVFLLAFSPAFFLTSLALYPHLFYFAAYAAAILCAWRLSERGGMEWACGLAGALVIAALSLHQWPVLVGVIAWLSWTLGGSPALRRLTFPLAVFGVLYGGWCVWETLQYGAPHFVATFQSRAGRPSFGSATMLPLVFLSGSLPATAIGWKFLWRHRRAWAISVAALLPLFVLFFTSARGGFPLRHGLLLGALLSNGLAWLAALAVLSAKGDSHDRMLTGWFLLEFLFVQFFLTYASGHHLLPLALPTVLIAVRMAGLGGLGIPASRVALAAIACLTIALAHADLAAARIGPRAAREIPREGRSFYWGNSFSGLSYYLKRAGWKPYDPRVALAAGDRMLIPRNLNTQGPPIALKGLPWEAVGQFPYSVPTPLRTLSIPDSAGWYSASWGPLPFSWGSGPAEVLILLEVKGPS